MSPPSNLAIITVAATALAALVGLLMSGGRKFFNEQRQNNPPSETHSICHLCLQRLPAGRTRRLPCGHEFHTNCISIVLEREVRQSCPYCRRRF